jgi:hypothetical protein
LLDGAGTDSDQSGAVFGAATSDQWPDPQLGDQVVFAAGGAPGRLPE